MVSDKGLICLQLVPTVFRYRTLVGSKIDIPEPEFYDDLVYKFRKIFSSPEQCSWRAIVLPSASASALALALASTNVITNLIHHWYDDTY